MLHVLVQMETGTPFQVRATTFCRGSFSRGCIDQQMHAKTCAASTLSALAIGLRLHLSLVRASMATAHPPTTAKLAQV